MTTQPAQPIRHHPSALYLLSVVELFERLAFGAMLPLFALYLHEHRGRSEAFAIALSSGFLAASYLASVPGGIIADRFVGAARAVFFGAILIATGFVGLATDRADAFWPALGALLLGQGLLKPNIANLLGGLYPAKDKRRAAGFFIFYVAINLGALVGPLLAEWARARWGWSSIFVCAAAAMLPVVLLLIPAGSLISKQVLGDRRTLASMSQKDERARLQALVLLCCAAVVFWLAFQQTGTSLALFAESQTEQRFAVLGWRMMLRPGHFAALQAGLVIGFTPLLLWAMGRLRERHAEPATPQKMVWGFLFTSAAFFLMAGASLRGGDSLRVSPLWLGGSYVLLALGELLLSPMGLSLVTQLGPPRLAGWFTGLWFASIAVGHGLAAGLGLLWTRWPHHRYFASVAGLALIGAAALGRRLRALEAIITDGRR